MHVGDLAGTGHFPTVSMVMGVANGTNFDATGILIFNGFKAERTTMFHGTRKVDICSSLFWCTN